MIASVYKPVEELLYTLKDIEKVDLAACSGCSNWSLVAGPRGLEHVKGVLEEAGKRINCSRIILSCCLETVCRMDMEKYFNPHASEVDAIVAVCCSAGVKGLNIAKPGVPVIPACDTLGSGPILARGDKKLPTVKKRADDTDLALRCPRTICADGHCVLSYTAGICPITECPKELKYGPCDEAFEEPGRKCVVYPEQGCAWDIINKEVERLVGSLDTLKKAECLHLSDDYQRMPLVIKEHTPRTIELSSRIVRQIFRRWTYPSYHWLD
jgi:hypothetical protein